MKLLMIIPRNPFPPSDGALLVIHDKIRTYQNMGCEVHLFILKGELSDMKIPLSNVKLHYAQWEPSKEIKGIILKCFQYRIPPLAAYYSSKTVGKEIEHLINKENFDYILIDHLHLSWYGKKIRTKRSLPISLFHHNIETDLYFSFLKSERLVKKPITLINAILTYFYEKNIYKHFNNNVFISEMDFLRARRLSSDIFKGSFLSATVDLNKYSYCNYLPIKNNSIKIGFIGSMNYHPNIEGVNWFINNVLPLLDKSNLEYKFSVVGKEPPESLLWLSQRNDNLEVTGWVDDDYKYYREMDVIVCPIFSGAGVKIKVLNALACGKILLATDKAVEGIKGLENRRHYLSANKSTEYSDYLLAFSSGEYEVINKDISRNAREFLVGYSNSSRQVLRSAITV